jgi:hypothetical protein
MVENTLKWVPTKIQRNKASSDNLLLFRFAFSIRVQSFLRSVCCGSRSCCTDKFHLRKGRLLQKKKRKKKYCDIKRFSFKNKPVWKQQTKKYSEQINVFFFCFFFSSSSSLSTGSKILAFKKVSLYAASHATKYFGMMEK